MGWTAAALVAATGCGSGSSASSPSVVVTDEHEGENEACVECKVTGGGVTLLDGQRVTFGLNAVPTGSGTVKGHIEIQLHDRDDGTNIFGTVDTIVACSRTDHVLIGTFQGTLRDGTTAFEVTVEDAGEPGRDDTIRFTANGTTIGPLPLEKGGNLQVHDLDRCEPPPTCPEGQCPCPDDPTQCEPCEAPIEPEPVTTVFIPL